ncbi:PTS sugar transporter subunit IIA [Roseomonas sp. KE2513]|uniref:PTS sugar transporter subunit IIA n=1 Tax=Roseomonas sp. KE2513 TaxID=2479202 RepID=UPI0018E03EB0|nr:PTS sugar transporter subunit IIA [Roseomonas sp. KE2513]MBI0539015.1 PTS sugar transporter subunit IIA [Roseomonas sp. KE2513]
MRITDLLSATEVTLDLGATNKVAVLQALSAEGARRLGRPEGEILEALQARERLGSTALGRGVALPHARLEGEVSPIMLFARLRRPVDFEARDEEPVDLVILVLWPEASPEGFLPTLSETCRALREPHVLRRLRAAQAPEEVVALLARPSPDSAP